MIKYFFVNNASRAAAYGIGTFARQMECCLQGESSQYELCFIDISSDTKEFEVCEDENGIRHYYMPAFQNCGNSLLYYKAILFLLDPYLAKDEKVVFHFNYNQHFDLIRLIKAQYPQSSIIFTVHYLEWCYSLNGNFTYFQELMTNNNSKDEKRANILTNVQNDKRLFSLCDNVVVMSKFAHHLLKEYYKIRPDKLRLIYNGMKDDTFTTKYRDSKRVSKEILFVGRLDEIKGIEYIIKAFKKISTYNNDIHLTLVGDGNFKRYLSLCEDIWDKVTFTGKVSSKKLEYFFSRATIGVQPSFTEQCSYSAIEMMAYGLPLIATDSTGLGDMMDKTPENLLHIDETDFNPETFVEQLADKMDILLNDEKLRMESSQKLLQLFHERYSLEHMRKSTIELLENCKQQDQGVSYEFLPYIDDEMIRLINSRPIIDFDFIGLTGIGCYLWWRIEELENLKEQASSLISARLQEHLIYYIDWVYDVIYKDGENAFSDNFEQEPFLWLVHEMHKSGFYKTKVCEILNAISHIKKIRLNESVENPGKERILQVALDIYNINF